MVYESVTFEQSLKFYVEQGAGVDFLARPSTIAHAFGAKKLLEIGPGYGFGIDFAEKALGMNAVGIDPSMIANVGSKQLGIEIISEYLKAESAAKYGLQDAIFAMEVIEHFANARPFLEIVRANLAPNGLFVLSTPNSLALEDASQTLLLSLLTPGYHAVLFSPDGLKAILEEVGFKHVRVEAGKDSLFALASDDPEKIASDRHTDPEVYANYTAKRMQDIGETNNPLWSGFAYRHFKTIINADEKERGWAFFKALTEEYKRRFDFDLADPTAVAARLQAEFGDIDGSDNRSVWAQDVPFHIGNMFYFAGILHLNSIGTEEAEPYLHATVLINDLYLRFHNSRYYNDLETQHLKELAEKLLLDRY
ncbi:MAG: class I SAM-dependent methyltransferase [Pseudomonadota bacterium]